MNHIIGVLPLITAVFGVQCYLMTQFTSDINVGNLALGLACGLISFVSGLFYYDKNHHVLIFSEHIQTRMAGLGNSKKILLREIAEIIAPEEEKNFATLVLKMKDDTSHVFYFVDHPSLVKAFLEKQIDQLEEDGSDESIAA